ncbi:MAG: hypothetical protein R6U19_05550 [Bacteroidales bacterium]
MGGLLFKQGINMIFLFKKKYHYLSALLFLLCIHGSLFPQSVSFEAKTTPDLDFVFNTVQDYQTGIVKMNAVSLNVSVSGTNWDMYVGSETTNAGFWDVVSTYSYSGSAPTADIIELRFRNANNTSQQNGFFSLTDIASPTYIIGSPSAPDPSIYCPNTGTNTAGDYLTEPSCYEFNVDIRINPDYSFQAGLYTLTIKYVIIEDL